MNQAKCKIMMIAGPTASGKSKLGLTVAQKLLQQQNQRIEIVNSDSVQMYQECNIGSNKCSMEERKLVPHHLIDTISLEMIDNEYTNAGWFTKQVKQLTRDIMNRNGVTLIIGGSGFYNELLFRGIRANPVTPVAGGSITISDSVVESLKQRKLNSEMIQEMLNSGEKSWDELYQYVHSVAPEIARGIAPNNVTRLSRAIERIQSAQNENINSTFSLEPVFYPDSMYDVRAFALYVDRMYLFDFIGWRCERIIENGLLEETFDLLKRGILIKDSIPYNAIGYRQSIEFLQLCTSQSDLNSKWLKEAFLNYVAEYKQATRRYARGQYNWLRRCQTHTDSNPIPPPSFMMLDMNNLFEALLQNEVEKVDQNFNQSSDHLLQYYNMSRDEYDSILHSNENRELIEKCKGESHILHQQYQEEGITPSQIKRKVIGTLQNIYTNKLYLYNDPNILENRCQQIQILLSNK
jgi:tRNA dimethylallyltransferase